MRDSYQALIDSLRDHQNGGRRNECEEAARAIETFRAELTEARRQLKEAVAKDAIRAQRIADDVCVICGGPHHTIQDAILSAADDEVKNG